MAKKEKSFLDSILEDFGEKVLDNHTKKIEAISTGSLALDSSIGIGGIPKGMITVLFGPEGSGKTTIALNTAKLLAESGKKTLYIDVENLLNTEILQSVLGEEAKIDSITILTPDSAEDAFIMAEKGIDSEEFELVIIDSIGSMASRKEKDVPFDKATMGQLPGVVAKFIKRNTYSIRTNNVAVLVLNQIRDNVGSYIKSYKMPGGHQIQHQAAVIIYVSRAEYWKQGDEKVGIFTKFVVQKNKLAPPFRSFTIPIMFGHGIDYYTDLIDFSKLLGVITGSGWYKFGDIKLGQGKAGTREFLMNSKETLDKIVERVYNIVNHETTIGDLLKDSEDETEVEEEGVLEE